MEAEKLGIPSVVVTTTGFSSLARLTGKSNGLKDLRIAEYPGPVGLHDPAEIRKNIEEVLLDRIVDGLSLSDESGSGAAASPAWNPQAIAFTGTFDDVNAYFAANEWGDGLPIVPPTIERVQQFLDRIPQAPDEPIAVLPSANLLATPWNIAVNAVMAGCLPEHMPIMIAAVRALGQERCSLANIGSTSMLVPFVLLNGPIVKELGIAHGAHLISTGPNAAIGRAVGLIVRNIAGFRPGKTYMGTFGYPLAFTIAESGDDSPWAPFHVGQGFDESDSTVTIGVTNNWGPQPSPASTAEQTGAQTALDLICREITKKMRLFDFPGVGPKAEKVMLTILLTPPIARSLADAGYSKDDVRTYVYENTKLQLREFDWLFTYTTPGLYTLAEKVAAGVYPPEFLGAPDDVVGILSSPNILHIVVCGDPHRNRLMVMEGGHTEPTTVRIEA